MKWLTNLTLYATLGLSNCEVLDGTLDKDSIVVGRDLATHATAEPKALKTTAREIKQEISELKTEILQKNRETIAVAGGG